jgi:uncharacterized membrane protein (UPF0182 family)
MKIIADMYDGTVTFYVMETTDPPPAVYQRAFPGVFNDLDQHSADLKAHPRFRVVHEVFCRAVER